MMRRVKRPVRRTIGRLALCALAPLAGLQVVASDAAAQEAEVLTDARLEGYAGDVKVENDSTALAWLFFVFLAVLGLSPLFKDAKRTHLD
jgi:hypothetical protein